MARQANQSRVVIEALLLSIGLAMDATAVAAARGVVGMSRRDAIRLATSFAVFQVGMAAIGWSVGGSVTARFAPWDRWIAFALLVLIGGKLLWEAVRRDGSAPPTSLRFRALITLSIATSIDALAAGVTLPVIPAPPPMTLIAIGVATFALSLAGGLGGSLLGARAGQKLEVLGGLVLIGIAIRTVVV